MSKVAPETCMFCWHPAIDWPDALPWRKIHLETESPLIVSDEIKRVPMCEHHLYTCIWNCSVLNKPEWWTSIEEMYDVISEKLDDLYDQLPVKESFRVMANALESIPVKTTRSIDPEAFDKWMAMKMVDLARRYKNGTGTHRCINSPCIFYVKNLGDQCHRPKTCRGTHTCGKGEKNVTDKVTELIAFWKTLE